MDKLLPEEGMTTVSKIENKHWNQKQQLTCLYNNGPIFVCGFVTE